MVSLKSSLLNISIIYTTCIFFFLAGCKRDTPNTLFVSASNLIKEGKLREDDSYLQAHLKYNEALFLLSKISKDFPQSGLAVEIEKGDVLVNGVKLHDIKAKIEKQIAPLAKAEGSLLETFLYLARNKKSPNERALGLLQLAHILIDTKDTKSVLSLLSEANTYLPNIDSLSERRGVLIQAAEIAFEVGEKAIALDLIKKSAETFSRSISSTFEFEHDLGRVVLLHVGLGQVKPALKLVQDVIGTDTIKKETYQALGYKISESELHQSAIDRFLGFFYHYLKSNQKIEELCLSETNCILNLIDTISDPNEKLSFLLFFPFQDTKESIKPQNRRLLLELALPIAIQLEDAGKSAFKLSSIAKIACEINMDSVVESSITAGGKRIEEAIKATKDPFPVNEVGASLYQLIKAMDVCNKQIQAQSMIATYLDWIEAKYFSFGEGTQEDFPALLISHGFKDTAIKLINSIKKPSLKFAAATTTAIICIENGNTQYVDDILLIADKTYAAWKIASNKPGWFPDLRLESYINLLFYANRTSEAKALLKSFFESEGYNLSSGDIFKFLHKYVPKENPFEIITVAFFGTKGIEEIHNGCWEVFKDNSNEDILDKCLDKTITIIKALNDLEQKRALLLLVAIKLRDGKRVDKINELSNSVRTLFDKDHQQLLLLLQLNQQIEKNYEEAAKTTSYEILNLLKDEKEIDFDRLLVLLKADIKYNLSSHVNYFPTLHNLLSPEKVQS